MQIAQSCDLCSRWMIRRTFTVLTSSQTLSAGFVLQTCESSECHRSHTLYWKLWSSQKCIQLKFFAACLEMCRSKAFKIIFHCQCWNPSSVWHLARTPHSPNYRFHYFEICKVNNWRSCNHSLLQRAQRKRQKFPLSMINCGINAITNVYYPEWKKKKNSF